MNDKADIAFSKKLVLMKDSWIKGSTILSKGARQLNRSSKRLIKDNSRFFGIIKKKYNFYNSLGYRKDLTVKELEKIEGWTLDLIKYMDMELNDEFSLKHFIGLFLEECNHEFAEVEGLLSSLSNIVDPDYENAERKLEVKGKLPTFSGKSLDEEDDDPIHISRKYVGIAMQNRMTFLDRARFLALHGQLKLLCNEGGKLDTLFDGVKSSLLSYHGFLKDVQQPKLNAGLSQKKPVPLENVAVHEDFGYITSFVKDYVNLINAIVAETKSIYKETEKEHKLLSSSDLASKKSFLSNRYDRLIRFLYFVRRPFYEWWGNYKGAFDLIDPLLYPFPSHSYAGEEDPWILFRNNFMNSGISMYSVLQMYRLDNEVPALVHVNDGYSLKATVVYTISRHETGDAIQKVGREKYKSSFTRAVSLFSDMAVHRVSHNSHFSSRPLTYEYGTALGIYLIPFNLFSSKKNEFYSALASVNGSHYTTLRSQANYSTLILRPSDESLKYGLRKLVTLANVTRHKYDRYKGMLLADIYRHREEDREQGIKRHALQSIAQRYEEMSEELYPYLKIMSERYLGVLISDLTSTSIFNTYHIDLGEGSPTFGSIFIGSYVPYSSKWSVAVSRCNIKASESDRMLTDFAAVSIRYVMGEPNRFMENFFGKSNVFKISFKEVEKKDEGLIDYLIEYLDILREMQSDIKQKKTGVHYEVLFNMKDRLRLMYERAERNYVESGNLKISIDLIESISKKIGELQDMQMDSSWLVRDLQDLIKHITRSVSDMKAGPYSIRRTFNIWRRGLTKN